MKVFAFFFCFLFVTATAQAASIGEGYGVQVKEGRTGNDELAKIKQAGFDYVRFVIPWYEVERGKNRFSWGYFDSFIARLREHKLKAVVVLGAGHPLYTEKLAAPEGNIDRASYVYAAPRKADEIAAFARYAARTVSHFGAGDIIWEIWNEPDSDRFWAPQANVEDYIALADAACRAIRTVAPEAKIIGPGMADTPGRFGHLIPGFLGKVLLSPAASCFDAVSVHPYRDGEKPPEAVLGAYEKLRTYIKAFTPEGAQPLPVYATEWGFTTTDVSADEQANYALRALLLNSLADVPISIWYEWRDAREGADDPEAHFGLLDLRKKEKESFKAIAAFLPPLKGATIEKRIAIGTKDDFVLALRLKDGASAIVFWTAGENTARKLALREGNHERFFSLTARPQTAFLSENDFSAAITE